MVVSEKRQREWCHGQSDTAHWTQYNQKPTATIHRDVTVHVPGTRGGGGGGHNDVGRAQRRDDLCGLEMTSGFRRVGNVQCRRRLSVACRRGRHNKTVARTAQLTLCGACRVFTDNRRPSVGVGCGGDGKAV